MFNRMKKYVFIVCFLLTGCAFQSITVTELMGKDKDYVSRKFGTPTVTRTEGTNQIWSYRDENCSRLIFFDQDNIVRWVDIQGSCEKSSDK